MCFHVPKGQRIKTAKKDIVCYKEIYPNLTSEYKSFQYEYKKIYSTENFPQYTENIWVNSRIISKGFHSYTKEKSYKDIYHWKISNTIRVECIIPKGSKYHVNKMSEEYVSEKIIICKKENHVQNNNSLQKI